MNFINEKFSAFMQPLLDLECVNMDTKQKHRSSNFL